MTVWLLRLDTFFVLYLKNLRYFLFKSARLLFCDGADGVAVVTVVVVPVVVATVEAEVVRVAVVAGVERTGPAVAVRAVKVESSIEAVARSREKYRIAVLDASNFITIN